MSKNIFVLFGILVVSLWAVEFIKTVAGLVWYRIKRPRNEMDILMHLTPMVHSMVANEEQFNEYISLGVALLLLIESKRLDDLASEINQKPVGIDASATTIRLIGSTLQEQNGQWWFYRLLNTQGMSLWLKLQEAAESQNEV